MTQTITSTAQSVLENGIGKLKLNGHASEEAKAHPNGATAAPVRGGEDDAPTLIDPYNYVVRVLCPASLRSAVSCHDTVS
jgi:hypothetical protein